MPQKPTLAVTGHEDGYEVRCDTGHECLADGRACELWEVERQRFLEARIGGDWVGIWMEDGYEVR